VAVAATAAAAAATAAAAAAAATELGSLHLANVWRPQLQLYNDRL